MDDCRRDVKDRLSEDMVEGCEGTTVDLLPGPYTTAVRSAGAICHT